MSLSEVVCHVTRTSGVTSLNLVEHDLIAKVQVPPMLLIAHSVSKCVKQIEINLEVKHNIFRVLVSPLKDGNAQNFRYDVKPKAQVSVFEPKDVPEGTDPLAMRATMLGAKAKNHFKKLPMSSMASQIWEVPRLSGL